MPDNKLTELKRVTGLDIYPSSVVEADRATYFLARRGDEKLIGCAGEGQVAGEKAGEAAGAPVVVGPTDHDNAEALRAALPWTRPRRLGLAASVGLGDRLGLAAPGHIRAARDSGLAVVLAQQSIREMARTQRTPEDVMDAATWGAIQEGFCAGFGADADHLQAPEDIDATVAAGFTLFTIDPGRHVDNNADENSPAELAHKVGLLDMDTLETRAADLTSRYIGRSFDCGGATIRFCDETLLRAAAKYGNAITHTVKMHRHLQATADGEVELEISVDETDSPTSPAEHYFFAAELKRLGVTWVSMAPRFIGRFEKGVDYIGDLEAFRRSFAEHVAVMRDLGPYKISIHSGSDKFSIYPIVAELAGEHVHLKTAGTSYLEALRAIAGSDPGLFREVLDFARERYETDKATYHVSADVSKVPPADSLKDEALADLLEQFDARQVLHVTYGSVLTADDGGRFRDRILAALRRDEERHYEVLARHLGRHVAPFRRP